MNDETIGKHDLIFEYIKKKHADIYLDKNIIEILKLNSLILEKDNKMKQEQNKVELMQSSKFWRLREKYLKLKSFFK